MPMGVCEKVFQVKNSLESMRILVDTREQNTERAQKRYQSFLCPYDRRKLEYGDYAVNFQLANGEWIYPQTDEKEKIYPFVAIERKMNLDELCQCFGRSRKRFEREFDLAMEHSARLYLLVEDATWEDVLSGTYQSLMKPAALCASLLAWQARYDMKVVFCKRGTSGTMIYQILYREIKEFFEKDLRREFLEK